MEQRPRTLPATSDRLRKLFIGIILMNVVIGLADLAAATVFIFKRAIEQFAFTHELIPRTIIEHLGISSQARAFAIFYFLSHGIIKLGLAGALLRNKLWAYPVAITFFGIFSIYQIQAIFGHSSLLEYILFLVNITVLISVSIEYRRITQSKVL